MFEKIKSLLTRNETLRVENPAIFAHLAVDFQRDYCDPAAGKYGTGATAAAASRTMEIAPLFRNAGIHTVIIGTEEGWGKKAQDSYGGFYKVLPASPEEVFTKYAQSAFENTDLGDRLKKQGVTTLIVSGVHQNICVNSTVQDALRDPFNFNVWVLTDCVANGHPVSFDPKEVLQRMRNAGAETMSSRQAIARLNTC